MRVVNEILEKNLQWANAIKENDPEFFLKLAAQQSREYVWVGCSDSHVPANELMGMLPGEAFMHRNIANLVIHTDLHALCVIQCAVGVLKEKNIMVVGYYGCDGIHPTMDGFHHALIDTWLRYIQGIQRQNKDRLDRIDDPSQRSDLLCELKVVEQMSNICTITAVQHGWKRGQDFFVHGWVYGLNDGIREDLGVCVASMDSVAIPRRLLRQLSDYVQEEQ